MKYNYLLITAVTPLYSIVGSTACLAQAPAPPNSGSPLELLEWGAVFQIATAIILLIGLCTILPRLRRIEEALRRSGESR